jgi:hypothetical protein
MNVHMIGIKLYPEMIKRKIDLMLKGEISTKKMIEWAEMYSKYCNKYYNIMNLKYTPSIVIIEKIIGLLKCDDYYVLENMKHMQMVLGGLCNDNYIISMIIPDNVEFLRKHIAVVGKIKSIMQRLLTNELLSEEYSIVLHSLENYTMTKTTLISDLIFMQILAIFIKMYDIKKNQLINYKFYFPIDEELSGRHTINWKMLNLVVMEKLKKLVDYYLGIERFHVIISFVAGNPYVNIS